MVSNFLCLFAFCFSARNLLGYYPQKPGEQPAELTPGHIAQRLRYAPRMRNKTPRWLSNLIAVDEVPFPLDGKLNHQTHR